MNNYLNFQSNYEDPSFVSIIDDLSLWSAPFGLKLLDTVHYKKNMRVLDIGFGLGFPLVELAMRLGSSSKVYGIDPWKSGIERTKLKLRIANVQNVALFEGKAEEMPFDDNYFDLVVSNNGINNVQDLSKTLMECSRVSRNGAQFVFTFNTDHTFKEFYDLYRKVLNENGLQEYENKIDTHIYLKRKPLSEFKNLLKSSGFRIKAIQKDEFNFRFLDGTSMLNHFFIKLAFLDAWKNILPEHLQEDIFQKIEAKMNNAAESSKDY